MGGYCHCFILYAMHYGYCYMHGYHHRFILYMLCTADTTTCLGIAIALYYIILCYALRIPPHPWTLPSLYTICYALLILPHAWVLPSLCITCYALRVLSHAWVLLSFCTVCYMQCACCQHVYVLPLLYIFMPPMVYNCMLCTQRC